METVLSSKVLEHVFISLLPLIVGLVLGGGLGVACALIARLLLNALPGLRKIAILVPWRTVLVTLILLIWVPFLAIRLGLGVKTGAISVGLIIFLVGWAATIGMLIEHWFPAPLGVRIIAGIRTVATASGPIAAGVGLMGGGGLGFLIIQGMRLLNYKLAWQGLLAVAILTLALDLVVGAVQLVVSYVVGGREKTGAAMSQEPAA